MFSSCLQLKKSKKTGRAQSTAASNTGAWKCVRTDNLLGHEWKQKNLLCLRLSSHPRYLTLVCCKEHEGRSIWKAFLSNSVHGAEMTYISSPALSLSPHITHCWIIETLFKTSYWDQWFCSGSRMSRAHIFYLRGGRVLAFLLGNVEKARDTLYSFVPSNATSSACPHQMH